ncbi:DUF6544 family protein [Erythrobacter sp. YT30]|uniref:DUF6544 family protein n=1 Tax=Erythrobacter sp. YT30 TaxID=1735012 RepID=UPI000AF23714|nr:DUF6544 family protein [Erythrobacter sp. YT30]
MWIARALGTLILGSAVYAWSTNLSREFKRRRREASWEPLLEVKKLENKDIAHLPKPVQRYIEITGSIGEPVVTEIKMEFEATMYDAPGAKGMTGPASQYDRFDEMHRLFFMRTHMKGLPISVLHDFDADRATMKVRAAGLMNVVDASGPELTRTETVTILNDIAFFAPSRLVDQRLKWTAVDDKSAKVEFTLGANTVSAELIFNDAGELVDFISEDRGMMQKDGTLRTARWSTPLGNYRRFGNWRLASEGDAIWHLPEGPFTYGHLRLVKYEAR